MNEQNLEQSQSQVPNPQKGISTLTGILIVLLVAVIASAGIWYYFNYYLNPDIEKSSSGAQITIPEKKSEEAAGETTTNKTADWKTYTNTEYGYSFKYPKSFYVVDDCYDATKKTRVDYEDKKWLVFVDKKPFESDFPYCFSDFPQPYLVIRAFNQPIDLALQKEASTTDLESEVTVASQKRLKIILTEPSDFDGSYSTVIHLNYKNKGYTISWGNSDNKDTHDSTIDTIVSTFKFTK